MAKNVAWTVFIGRMQAVGIGIEVDVVVAGSMGLDRNGHDQVASQTDSSRGSAEFPDLPPEPELEPELEPEPASVFAVAASQTRYKR